MQELSSNQNRPNPCSYEAYIPVLYYSQISIFKKWYDFILQRIYLECEFAFIFCFLNNCKLSLFLTFVMCDLNHQGTRTRRLSKPPLPLPAVVSGDLEWPCRGWEQIISARATVAGRLFQAGTIKALETPKEALTFSPVVWKNRIEGMCHQRQLRFNMNQAWRPGRNSVRPVWSKPSLWPRVSEWSSKHLLPKH